MKNKVNKSAYQFLLCLIYILKRRIFSVEELCMDYENDDIYLEFETILKYIRTLKKLGFVFYRKTNKIYELKKIPFVIDANDDDKYILCKLLNILSIYDKSISFIDKVYPLLNKDFSDELKNIVSLLREDNLDNHIKQIKKYYIDKQRLYIEYVDNCILKKDTVELYQYTIDDFKNLSLFCYGLREKSNIIINASKIKTMSQTPIKNKFVMTNYPVTLRFLSKFAKSYTLKDGEEILERGEGYLLVRSIYFDKKELYKRILRYMGNCEIVSPEFIRKDFLLYVKNIEKDYA